MLKKSYLVFLFLFAVQSLFARIDCEPQLKPALETIQKLPEAQELINNILKEGSIRIIVNRQLSAPFGAFWGSEDRTICVNCAGRHDLGEIIGSIIFEMHNAAIDKDLNRLDSQAYQGKINRNNYVRSIEYLEYCNSLKASALVTKGIERGIYPRSAYLPTYESFDIHYRVQQEAGHSAWIARNYDDIVAEARASSGIYR